MVGRYIYEIKKLRVLTHITKNESDIRDMNGNCVNAGRKEKIVRWLIHSNASFWLVTENEKEMKTEEKFTFSSCLNVKWIFNILQFSSTKS